MDLGHGAFALVCLERGQRPAGHGVAAASQHLASTPARQLSGGRGQTRRPAAAVGGRDLFLPPCCGWVITSWQGTQLALALDATSLGSRFVVLAVSVLYRGCAVPVAWVVLPANRPGAWRPHWLRLLRRLHRVIPRSWTVIVLSDRGLYARWLYRRLVRLGWHPCLRINTGGTFHAEGHARRYPLKHLVPEPGTQWAGRGVAFTGRARRLACTLLACWEPGYKDPWLLVTDLAPEASEAAWYGLRAWIEQGFKVAKRGGWQWQRTRMRDAQRAHPAVVGAGPGDVVAAQCRGRGRGDDCREHLARGRWLAVSSAALDAGALSQCLSPGLASDSGGVVASGRLASRTFFSRAMADPRAASERGRATSTGGLTSGIVRAIERACITKKVK